MYLKSLITLALGLSCHADPLTLFIGTNGSIYTAKFSTEKGTFSDLSTAYSTPSSSFLTFSADGKTLYSTFSVAAPGAKKPQGGVASYAVSPDGSISFQSTKTSGGMGTCHVSLDQTGKCLFSADYGSGHLSSYVVNEQGNITSSQTIKLEGSSTHPTRQKSPHAHSIYATPDNKHVYAADLGTDDVLCYSLDPSTAKLTHLSSAKVPAGSGPRHIAIHPDGKRLFVLNELSCTLSTFTRDTDSGKLTLLDTTSVLKDGAENISCSEVTLSPDAKHLYTGNRDIGFQKHDSISHFTVPDEADKAPTLQQTLTLPISIPRHFTITPDGKWVIAGGQKSNNLIAIQRDNDSGSLTLTGNTIEVPGPTCILIQK